jgi:2-C-methyl-D-erythritol 4-phosphate cytidylyltransferase / 2-C-methyl-D-erythritol 2,4-cyclodiphosphate synthase
VQLAIILVAAGSSSRMGFPKLWTDVCGQPLLAHALAAARAAMPAELIVVVSADRLTDAEQLAPDARVVAGGARRRDSVSAGLSASTSEWLAIHDAARALAPPEVFARGLAAAQPTGAAIPVVPLKDTIKRVASSRVIDTPARAEHVAVQTPQIFRRDILHRALSLTDEDVTDEAALVEQLGISVATFEGDDRAFKVTTPLDFALARTLLQ